MGVKKNVSKSARKYPSEHRGTRTPINENLTHGGPTSLPGGEFRNSTHLHLLLDVDTHQQERRLRGKAALTALTPSVRDNKASQRHTHDYGQSVCWKYYGGAADSERDSLIGTLASSILLLFMSYSHVQQQNSRYYARELSSCNSSPGCRRAGRHLCADR